MLIDVTSSMLLFRDLLNASWSIASQFCEASKQKSFMNDWIEANWEFLVEASISPSENFILEPYGDGADCNLGSSRVWHPDKIPNSRIYVDYNRSNELRDVLNNSPIPDELFFDRFCSFSNGWFYEIPPFDHVILQGDIEIVLKIDGLRYNACKF